MRLDRANGKDVLRYSLKKDETVSIGLYDARGKLLKSLLGKSKMNKGGHEQPMDLPKGLSPGRYYVVLFSAQGRSGVEFVK